MIRIQGLHKYFNKGRQNEIHVINDVNLELPDRGMVAIFGKSGCGKTTLLNVIGGLDRFAEGSLTIEGRDIREETDTLRNQYVGYIFQNYNLNRSETCYENVAAALRLCGMTDEQEIATRVTAALSNVDMAKYAQRTPDTLSGGQQQRIAIARAIVKNPRIILADEPTGNLDEANTVMIMDLLKAISRDHLVLLVTHEANLVDFYCDRVIELSDGRIVGTKENAGANGFAARDKNDIFLGELAHTALCNESAEIDYYGNAPEEPIRLRIVNHGGKLYVQINSERVQVLDAFSEVKLREGVYEEAPNANSVSQSIDMSALPPVEGTRHGRLFSLKSSIKSGYLENFKKQKRGKKVLSRCMGLFAAVVVLMSAVFGTAFDEIINARASYNHNVFYLYTPDAATSEKLNAALGDPDTGIDYLRLSTDYPRGDTSVSFHTGSFETFSNLGASVNLTAHAVYVGQELANGLPLVAGTNRDLAIEELLITTRVADDLLESSPLGYIEKYEDLIGLISTRLSVDGKNMRVAGVVESDETAIFLPDLAMAKHVLWNSALMVTLGSEQGYTLNKGETELIVREMDNTHLKYPKAGEHITIHGVPLTVTKVRRMYYDYESWLAGMGIEKMTREDFYREQIRKENPELTEGPAFDAAYKEAKNTLHCHYFDYYYAEADAFLADYFFFEPGNFELWLYLKKGIADAKFLFLGNDPEYYTAYRYKKLTGSYPTMQVLKQQLEDYRDPYDALKGQNYYFYEEEFWSQPQKYISTTYMVSDHDYVAMSRTLGETHPSAGYQNGEDYEKYGYVEELSATKSTFVGDAVVDSMYYEQTYYTVIHSSDPDKTAAWLAETFPNPPTPNFHMEALITPTDLFDNLMQSSVQEIVASMIAMGVLLILMSMCMYFIMRSSLMNRIKEVGIYRAIGVNKRNMIFKFLIEAVVLTTLTVFVGYLLISGFLALCLGSSTLMTSIFFYPWWYALLILVVLYAISLFFGVLPILSLLRRTPSEILAKYDI